MRKKNIERAGWARVGIDAFAKKTGLTKADGLETMIVDFLGDLLHYCDLEGLNYEDLIRQARANYDAEQSYLTENS